MMENYNKNNRRPMSPETDENSSGYNRNAASPYDGQATNQQGGHQFDAKKQAGQSDASESMSMIRDVDNNDSQPGCGCR